MSAAFAIIPARTERQAMDWSLVLVSQGIDAVIERTADSGAWQLVVQAPDYARAVEVIRLYHRENARSVWHREVPWTGLLFDARSAAWALVLVLLYALNAADYGALQTAGMMNNEAARAGQWWRVFTAVFLHADLAHLAANAVTGFILLGLAMGAFGPGPGLLAPLLAGAAGNVAGLLAYPASHRGLGASGMVMGALGLLAAQSLALLRHGLTTRQLAARGVLSGCLLLILLGFSPERNVDVLAHVVGFGTGGVLGALLAFLPPAIPRNAVVNRIAATLACGLFLFTWWLALRSGRV